MMDTSPRAREEAVVRQLRSRYERDGYQYFEYPSRDLLPHFLGSYRPDAIAIGPGRNVAIEVKAQAGSSDEPLAELAQLFEGHPNWEFRVVVAAKSEEDEQYEPARWGDLLGTLEEAQALSREGRLRPAIVLGWSLVEAYARFLGLGEPGATAGPRQIVQWLTSEGELTQRASRLFRRLIPARNAVVHGDFTALPDPSDVATFLEELGKLVEGCRPQDDQRATGIGAPKR